MVGGRPIQGLRQGQGVGATFYLLWTPGGGCLLNWEPDGMNPSAVVLLGLLEGFPWLAVGLRGASRSGVGVAVKERDPSVLLRGGGRLRLGSSASP